MKELDKLIAQLLEGLEEVQEKLTQIKKDLKEIEYEQQTKSP